MFNGFYEGWMKGVAELKDPGNRRKGVKYLAEFLQFPEADAEAMMSTVHLASHGDNMNFFGINDIFLKSDIIMNTENYHKYFKEFKLKTPN